MSTPSKTRQQLIAELNEAVQDLGNLTVLFTHAIASHIGLSATEFECCDILGRVGAVPAGRLAELTGLTTGAITGIIDRLERAGYARREPDPTDRRRVIIHPVKDSQATATIIALYQPLAKSFGQLTAAYTDQQLATVLDFITHSIAMTKTIATQMRAEDAKLPKPRA
jgi:DNA-binding MarR family transcriptional regulator